MKNLTQVFLNSAPSRFKLPFGINKNVILKAVSNEVRRDKNNLIISKNCYLTFSHVDVTENNKVIAESTFSYFNIDNGKYAAGNFIHQFTQIGEIIGCIIPKAEIKEVTAPMETVKMDNIELFGRIAAAKSNDKEADPKFVKEMLILQKKIVDSFVEVILPYIGDTSPLLQLLVVTDRTGKFYDLPREDKGFISKMGAKRKLSIDAKYQRFYDDRNTPEASENDDIGGEEILDEELMLEDDAQMIDDI